MRALTFALTFLANVNPSCPQRDRQQGDKDQNLDALPERQSRDGCDAGAVQVSGKERNPQAIRAIQIAQNAMLMATVAASMTTNEVFLIFHFLSKAKLKAKGRLPS